MVRELGVVVFGLEVWTLMKMSLLTLTLKLRLTLLDLEQHSMRTGQKSKRKHYLPVSRSNVNAFLS